MYTVRSTGSLFDASFLQAMTKRMVAEGTDSGFANGPLHGAGTHVHTSLMHSPCLARSGVASAGDTLLDYPAAVAVRDDSSRSPYKARLLATVACVRACLPLWCQSKAKAAA